MHMSTPTPAPFVVRNLHTGMYHEGGPYWCADLDRAQRHTQQSAEHEQRNSRLSAKLRGECVVIGAVS